MMTGFFGAIGEFALGQGPSAAAGGGTVYTVHITDGIYFDDPTTKGRQSCQQDPLLCNDPRSSKLLKTILEGLLTDDARSSKLLKTILDPVLTADQRVSIHSSLLGDQLLIIDQRSSSATLTQTDALLLLDARYNTLVKVAFDGLLMTDSGAAFRVAGILQTENLLLNDLRSSVLIKVEQEGLLIRDDRYSTTIKYLADFLLLSDSMVLAKIKSVYNLDTLFVDDQQRSIHGRVMQDPLFLYDEMTKLLKLMQLDNLLLNDSVLTTTLAGVISVIIQDGLFLDDARTSQLRLLQLEGAMITDLVTRAWQKFVVDPLLLNDTVLAVKMKVIFAEDGLMLSDARMSKLAAVIRDDLFFLETRASLMNLTYREGLLLVDSVIRTRLAGVFQTDTLYLTDNRLSLLASKIVEGLFLNDERFSKLAKILGDQLFLSDSRTSTLLKLLQEMVMLGDGSQRATMLRVTEYLLIRSEAIKLLKKIVDDPLLISDSVTRTVTQAVVEALVWALIKTYDLLSSEQGVQVNLLGIVPSTAEFMVPDQGTQDNLIGRVLDQKDCLTMETSYLQLPYDGVFD